MRSHLTAVCKVFPSGVWSNKPADRSVEENDRYCDKDDDEHKRLEPPERFGLATQQGKTSELTLVVQALKDPKTTMHDISINYTRCHILHGVGILNTMNTMHIKTEVPRFKVNTFPPPWSKDLADDLKTHTVVIGGITGCGKTEFAIAFLHETGGPVLKIDTDDAVKRFDPKIHTGGLVFDDVDDLFSNLSRERRIKMVEQDRSVTIKIRYLDIEIPAHTRKIFTTNAIDLSIFTGSPAVARRVKIRMVEPFDKNPADELTEEDEEKKHDAAAAPAFISLLSDDDEKPGVLVRTEAQYLQLPEQRAEGQEEKQSANEPSSPRHPPRSLESLPCDDDRFNEVPDSCFQLLEDMDAHSENDDDDGSLNSEDLFSENSAHGDAESDGEDYQPPLPDDSRCPTPPLSAFSRYSGRKRARGEQ